MSIIMLFVYCDYNYSETNIFRKHIGTYKFPSIMLEKIDVAF